VLDGQLDGFIDDAIRMRAEQRRRGDGGKGGALRGGDGKGPTPTEI
jgi:hypothetical protein